MTYDDVSDVIIYKTNDYDKFKYHVENRSVTRNKELEKVILERNKLKYNPIIVSDDYSVTDGQHRLEVAKKHKLPIYYVIDTDYFHTDIQKLNVANKNWRLDEHLHFFCQTGKVNYKIIHEWVTKYKIGISALIQVVGSIKGTSSISQIFKRGEIEFKYSKHFIETCLQQYQQIYLFANYYFEKYRFPHKAQIALLRLVVTPGYDHNHFMKKIKSNPDLIDVICTVNDSERIRNMLQKTYNKQVRDKRQKISL